MHTGSLLNVDSVGKIMNTCVVTKNFDLIIMPKKQFRLQYDYNYKYYRYHHDPEYRRKCINNAIEWRRQHTNKKHREPKEPRFKIQVRKDGEMVTVFELS